MFHELRIANFKNWGADAQPVKLAPITLLLGVNSAGKTSLVQPLLLLKQTVQSPDRRLHLNLGGQDKDAIDFGTFRDLVYEHDEARTIGIGFRFGLAAIEYDVEYGQDESGAPVVQRLEYRAGMAFQARRTPDGKYLLQAIKDGSVFAGSPMHSAPERSVAFSIPQISAFNPYGDVAQDLTLSLTRELENISYLGPLRERSARSSAWDRQTPTTLGARAQFTIHRLIAAAYAGEPLIAQVSEWLRRMGIADQLKVESSGATWEVSVVRNGHVENLIDVGFGVSQVLPVITLALVAPKGSTVILEEPEMHLHPSAQGVLAELFTEVHRDRNVQFIVETHSEHLFRRLQTLVAEGATAQEDCKLYFVERNGNGAHLSDLRLDRYGRVENWSAGFFAESMDEVERRTRSMFERMEKEGERG